MGNKTTEEMAIELVEWMLSGQEGSMTYVCMNSEDASEVYKEAKVIFSSIMSQLKWGKNLETQESPIVEEEHFSLGGI